MFFSCFQLGFHFLATGWIFHIDLFENSIKRLINQSVINQSSIMYDNGRPWTWDLNYRIWNNNHLPHLPYSRAYFTHSNYTTVYTSRGISTLGGKPSSTSIFFILVLAYQKRKLFEREGDLAVTVYDSWVCIICKLPLPFSSSYV